MNLSIDKLEITYQATQQVRDALAAIKESEKFREIRLLRTEATMSYEHCFILFGKDYNKGRIVEHKIGSLYFGSYNKYRPYIYIRYDNAALYDDYLLASRFYVEDALGLDFLRMSKIDIALDININLIRRFYRVYKDEAYSLIILNKRYKKMDEEVKEVLHFSTGTRKSPFKNRSFTIGKDGNPLSLRCYNKTIELEDSKKEYIPIISGKKPMYRLEVSLANHKNIVKTLELLGIEYEDEAYSKLQDEDFLADLFNATLGRIIRVGKGRKSYGLLQILLK